MTAIIRRWVAGPLLLAALLAGCASGPSGGSPASNAGGASADQTQGASVTVLGNVTRREIPWQDGLTLMQAFALSGYLGDSKPAQLGIIRKKQMPIYMDYQKLYDGQDMLLEPGDQVVIRP
jgi:hypothetical protein